MEKLDALASVVRLGDRVVRILGQNPGKFTLQGTNTYLIGETPPYTLIDTGEGRPSYIPFLESALEHGTNGPSPRQRISDIIISHWHPDHVGGLFSVLSLLRRLWDTQHTSHPFQPPRIHKFPHTTLPDDRFQHAIEPIKPSMHAPSPDGSLFHDLLDGQTFAISSSENSPHPDATFQVIHSPGHTEDSISLLFPSERALYTSDTVLGQGTSVFEDLGTYLSTLGALLMHIDDSTVLYPGHGPVVRNGQEVIKTYIEHRMEREAQIIQLLQQTPGKIWSTWDIVSKIYAAYPRELWEAAVGSVNQHLQKLLTEKRVEKLGGEGKDTKWRLQAKL